MSTTLAEDIVLASDEIIANLHIIEEDVILAVDSHWWFVQFGIEDEIICSDEQLDLLWAVVEDSCNISDEQESQDKRLIQHEDIFVVSDEVSVLVSFNAEIEVAVLDLEDNYDVTHILEYLTVMDVVFVTNENICHVEVVTECDEFLHVTEEVLASWIYVLEDYAEVDDVAQEWYVNRDSIMDLLTINDETQIVNINLDIAAIDALPVMNGDAWLTELVIHHDTECAILARDEYRTAVHLAYSVRDLAQRLEI